VPDSPSRRWQMLLCAAIGLVATPLVAQTADDKPVEQTRKNIRVLQGLPDSQLFLLMNTVSDSLGIACDFCHVKEGTTYVWERDDKRPKTIARGMMQMVLDLNRTRFDGAAKVTCYTCHRGQTTPGRVPPLPPPIVLSSTPPALPGVDAILAKYVSAVGGQDAVGRVSTVVLKGTDTRSENRVSTIELSIKGPDKLHIVRTTGGTTARQGFDGAAGWTATDAGVQSVGADIAARLRRAVTLYSPIKILDPPGRLSVTGRDTIGSRTAYVVESHPAPATTLRYAFDSETGLLLRVTTLVETRVMPLPDQMDFEDYREVAGVRMPFTIRVSNSAPFDTSTRTFTAIVPGAPLDDSLFRRPDK
jgi:Photosynthetic reaction centre cytochrome C subunit